MSDNPMPAGLLAEAERLFRAGAIPETGRAAAEAAAAALSLFLPGNASEEECEDAMNEVMRRLARKHPQIVAGALASLMTKGTQCRAEEAFAGVVQRFAERGRS